MDYRKPNTNQQNNNIANPRVLSLPLVLISKEPERKIAKVNDNINPEKTLLTRDPQTRLYKITEKKSNKSETKYSGTHMAEQSSKYLIFKFNSESGKIEVCPAGEWFDFKKEITYPTMTIEEAEEKMKSKSGLLDYLRNKGGSTKTKAKKSKDSMTITVSSGGRRAVEEEEEEKAPLVESPPSEEDKDDLDLDLKEAPSDIEEDFIKGKKNKEETKNDALDFSSEEDNEENDELFDDDDEDLDNENDDESDVDSEALIDRIDADANHSGRDFISQKRKGDEAIYDYRPGEKKQRIGSLDLIPRLEEALLNTLSKNKRITHANILKELSKLNFSKIEIDNHLNTLLSKLCDKFLEGSDFYYFKKSEK